MHELAIADEIVRITLDHAAGAKVLRVVLEIGAFVGVEPQSVAFCFESLTRGTLAEGAELVIHDVPGEAHCLGCGVDSPRTQLWEPCPACGGHALDVLRGRELRVKELEVA